MLYIELEKYESSFEMSSALR